MGGDRDTHEVKITEERYESMQKRFFDAKEDERKRQLSIISILDKMEENHDNTEKYINLIGKFINLEELNAEVLNQLIERIMAHEKTVNEDGSKSQ